MKICIISDTHNKHKQLNLPSADMIIHCGDFTSLGKEHEIRKFFKWYSNLEQYKYKIIIAGNHDLLFENSGSWARSLVPKNVHYLEDTEIIIEGFRIYGTPVCNIFYNWAFMKPEEKLAVHYAAIPDDTDVLITHNPPHGILDMVDGGYEKCGSQSLYNEVVNRIKPLIHCFGHIHSGHGKRKIENTTYINASSLDEDYNCVYSPIVVEI